MTPLQVGILGCVVLIALLFTSMPVAFAMIAAGVAGFALIVTPHAAWYSQESLQRVKDQGLDEVVRVLKGLRPWYAVNPEVLARR